MMMEGENMAFRGVDLTIELRADSLESLDEFLEMAEDASKQHPGIPIHMVVKVG